MSSSLSDQARSLGRQAGPAIVRRADLGKVGVEAIGHDLEDAFGAVDVAKCVLAEIDRRHACVVEPAVRARGQQDLPTVTGRHHPGTSVQRGAEVVAVAFHRLAGVDPHTHPDADIAWPRLVEEGALGVDCGIDRTGGVWKAAANASPAVENT